MIVPLRLIWMVGLWLLSANLNAQSIDRIEPPMWWTGMKNSSLQLMAYGTNIGLTKPELKGAGISLVAVHQLSNPNYLFIDLRIDRSAEPGNYEIVFKIGDRTVTTISYELLSRETGSARRKGFDNSDVMYLITPDRFANGDPNNDVIATMKEGLNREEPFGRHGGDLRGMIDHLDYIDELGFTAIWLNPVLQNDQAEHSYHGYSTTDYYRIDERFGSNEEYLELSKKAADRGIGLIMDIIVNHCGSDHWWMDDPPSDDWINNHNQPYQQTNHLKATLLDPYVAKVDREKMVEGWFVPTMPDLNQRNPFLATYLIQNSIWWIEYAGITGIRQDTYSYPFREFMTDWTCAIMTEYPNFNIVGEEWVENPAIIAYWQKDKINDDGYTSCLPSLMDFPMTMALHKALIQEEGWNTGLRVLYENLANDFHYPYPENMVIFPDNHDMSRIFTQVNEDYDLYKMALTYVLTMRGIPQLYYGTEILMGNRGTTSHGVIRSDLPGGWPDDTVNVFEGKGLTANQEKAMTFVKKILRWRKSKSVIHWGALKHYVPLNGVYVYFRYDDNDKVMVVLNKNNEITPLSLDRFRESLGGSKKGVDVVLGRSFSLDKDISLPGRSALILELN